MLIQDFAVNQTQALATHNIDPQIQGVCWAMSYDWIKRALCTPALPRTQQTYAGARVTKFSSQQRAYAQSADPQRFQNQTYARDELAVDHTRGSLQFNFNSVFHMIDFIDCIDNCPVPCVGYLKLIGPAGNHGTAFSKDAAGGSFFDPLVGQYAHGGGADTFGEEIYEFLEGPPPRYAVVQWRIDLFTGVPRDHGWLLHNP